MKILITGVGGPTPRSFALSLKKFGSKYQDAKLIATDNNPLSIGLYQNDLFEKSYLVPGCNEIDYWDKMKAIINENEIDFAVVLPELEVIEWSNYIQNNDLPCKVFSPNYELACSLVDKAKLTELLLPLDLTPLSFEFERNFDQLEDIFTKLGDEFWVRSSKGTSGLGSLKITNLDSLKNWIQINTEVTTFLASKFLVGRNLACKLLYWNRQLVRAASGERVNYIMSKIAPSGITGNTSFGRLLNEEKLVKVASEAMAFLFKQMNIEPHGFFTVDLKEDENGIPFITEINVRHVAFTQCFAAAGANFPEDTIRLLNNDITFDKSYKMYEFEKDLIFLRDVDAMPILMKEHELLK